MMLSITLSRFVIIKAICCAFLLSACATTPEPIIRTVEVRVPVAVSCVPDIFPGQPDYPPVDDGAPDAEWLAAILAGDEMRRDRIADLEAVVDGCRSTTQ
jgi:hypothetical protein